MTANLELTGAARGRWLKRAALRLSDRRLNRSFMAPNTLAALCGALVGQAGALDTRGSLELDRRSGLPTLTAFLRARARLADTDVQLDRFVVNARVRRLRQDEADVRVTVDRFDPTDSLFKRTTIELTSQGSKDVLVAGELAHLSGELRDTLYTWAGADPEILFLRLTAVPRVVIHEVARGRTGPLLFAGVILPEPLKPIFHDAPDAMLLCCGTARVATGLTGDRATDPLRSRLATQIPDADYPGARYNDLKDSAPQPYGTHSAAVVLCSSATARQVAALPWKKTTLVVSE